MSPDPFPTLSSRWRAALATPERVFLVDARDGSVFTVAEMDHLSLRAVAGLRALDLGPGGRLILEATPEIETLVLLVGALRLGVAVALLHPQAPAARIRETLGLWPGARLLLSGSAEAILDAPPAAPPEDPDPDGDAAVIFSSGSTGPARGVRLSWRALAGGLGRLAQVEAAVGLGPSLGPGAREGVAALLHTVSGYRLATLAPLLRGTTTVLLPSDASAAVLLGLAAEQGVGLLHVGPGFARACNRAPDRHRALVGRALRAVSVGGGALSDEERVRLADTLNVMVIHTYGLTETAGMCAAARILPGRPNPPGVGRPVMPVRVVGPEGAFGAGRIEVAPPAPPLGYLGGTSCTADPEGRWIDTGDLGWLDAEGNLHVLGRASRLHTLPSGEKLQLEDVEREIRARLGVAVAVVAVSQVDREPRIGALVAGLAPTPAWERRARDRLREALPEVAIPVLWRSCEALPQTATGKVDFADVLVLCQREDDLLTTFPPHPAFGHLLPQGEGEELGFPLLPEGEGAPAGADEGEGR